MIHEIDAWLNRPSDYALGLALLEQTGYTGFALTLLRGGPDAYNRKRLATELQAWLRTQSPVVPVPKVVTPPVPRVEVSQVDQLTAELEQQAYPLFDARSALKSQLWAVRDDAARQADRRDWAYQIKAITRQLDALYADIDFVKQYGYMPPEVSLPTEVDESALLMNVRTYVSRYRKKLKVLVDQGVEPTDPRFCATDTLLKQYLDQKNQLELKLSKNNDSHPTRQQT